jgi:hypothetical protein
MKDEFSLIWLILFTAYSAACVFGTSWVMMIYGNF